jgi:hypothetical protein
MVPSTYGSYTLPLPKVDSLSMDIAYVDAFETADEMDGSIPLMGTAGTLVAEASISVVHMIGRSFLQGAYDLTEGGLDTALHDFAINVFAGGIKTLTLVPNPGTIAYAGGAGLRIVNWQCDAEVAKQRSVHRHPGGMMVYAEVSVTYLIHSTLYVVNLLGGTSITAPIY